MAKLELITTPAAKENTMLAGETEIGDIFRTEKYQGDGWYLRVYPTGYLTNSTTVTESMNAGKPFVVNLLTGALSVISPRMPVILARKAVIKVER